MGVNIGYEVTTLERKTMAKAWKYLSMEMKLWHLSELKSVNCRKVD